MKVKNKRVLVTGGAGFIGSHLVDALYKNNHIIILDNFSSGKRENIQHHEESPNVKIVTGDIRDKDLLYKITRDIDIVYHLAVQCLRVSIKDPEINHEVNATGTLNLCMASLQNSVKRFVYISSSEVYGTAVRVPMDENHPCEPMTVYGASKLAGEVYSLAYNRTYGLNSIVVRPFNTYGPREHFEGAYGEVIPKFVLRVLNNEPPVIFGDGTQTRDFTYVTDTVMGIIMASGCDAMIGQTVNIASGNETSVNTLSEIITRKLSRENLRPVYEKNRPGDVKRHLSDISKAQKTFEYTPRVDIEQGLQHYIEWFKSKNYNYAALAKQDIIFNW
ncbi:MAG: GDP-mannose 4,6-dehydratase [Thermodesulfovibrionia bacterium]|nr:GDP-mannose 4,6-dehydratase [Thermodesulfovibrionia bacterium]